MADSDVTICFEVPATLRKWPSVNNQRVSHPYGGKPYLITQATLDDCIRDFMAKPVSQQHLYEIHTAPQGQLASGVLSAKQIAEITRLRDYL
jgi:hypothetical protein